MFYKDEITAPTNGAWRHAESNSGASPSSPPVLIDNTLMGRNYPEALRCCQGLLVSSRHSILDQFPELLFPSVTAQTQQGRWRGVKKANNRKKGNLGSIDSWSRQPQNKYRYNSAVKAASFTIKAEKDRRSASEVGILQVAATFPFCVHGEWTAGSAPPAAWAQDAEPQPACVHTWNQLNFGLN